MNYRILLSGNPGRNAGFDIDFDKTVIELLVEIDNQIYRVNRHQIKDEPIKPIIGEMFIEIGEQLNSK